MSPTWRQNIGVCRVHNSLWSRTCYRVEHLLCNKFTHPVHLWFLHTWLMYKRTQLAFPWKLYTYLHKFKISFYKNTQRSCLLRFKATIPVYKPHCTLSFDDACLLLCQYLPLLCKIQLESNVASKFYFRPVKHTSSQEQMVIVTVVPHRMFVLKARF